MTKAELEEILDKYYPADVPEGVVYHNSDVIAAMVEAYNRAIDDSITDLCGRSDYVELCEIIEEDLEKLKI